MIQKVSTKRLLVLVAAATLMPPGVVYLAAVESGNAVDREELNDPILREV